MLKTLLLSEFSFSGNTTCLKRVWCSINRALPFDSNR